MDPLGFAASIIAVLGAAKAGYKALEKIHHTRKAPGGVSDLLDELGCFKALLEEITELVDPQRGLQGDKHLQDLVQRGGKIVGDINTLTAQTWPSIHFFKLSEANRQRVTVLKDGGKLKTLKDNLRIIHFDLVAGLSIVSVYVTIVLGFFSRCLYGAMLTLPLARRRFASGMILLQRRSCIKATPPPYLRFCRK